LVFQLGLAGLSDYDDGIGLHNYLHNSVAQRIKAKEPMIIHTYYYNYIKKQSKS